LAKQAALKYNNDKKWEMLNSCCFQAKMRKAIWVRKIQSQSVEQNEVKIKNKP